MERFFSLTEALGWRYSLLPLVHYVCSSESVHVRSIGKCSTSSCVNIEFKLEFELLYEYVLVLLASRTQLNPE